ncbi:MAG: hypothetical protein ABSC17_06700 [Thermacetogeniaceae bacterium]
MAKVQRKDGSVSHIANLLTSILLCYPEIGTINLDPKTNLVKFTFYLSSSLNSGAIGDFKKHMRQSLEAYYYLINKDVEVCTFSFQTQDCFTTLEFQRDVLTLTQKEVALIIALLKEQFEGDLIANEEEDLLTDDLTLQEELIGRMLEHTREASTNSRLIALRDEGRVLVFNK